MTLLTSSGVFLVLGKKTDKEKLGYYEIENIDNPSLVSLAVNPKEYLELLKDMLLNKKHGGIKKGSTGMGFENFAQRIKSLVNYEMRRNCKKNSSKK